MNETEEERLAESSFIHDDQPNIVIRVLRIIDIFSFLPVPKDDAVSTKRSIVGSLLFFALFLTYIIYDFVGFVYDNPPIEQIYRQSLDDKQYTIPQFSIAFMTDTLNNYTEAYEGLFTYQMVNITKSQGGQQNDTIPFSVSQYNQTGNDLEWMSDATKRFYYVQRYPTVQMKAKGLLYSTDSNTYIRVKISYCTNSSACLDNQTMANLSSYGRFFLFIKNDPDTSVISRETLSSNGNNYLLYNFFVIPNFYKRININFQVVQTTVLPDYFNEFTTKVTTRLQIQSIFEQLSFVNYNASNTDAIAFNMQLSPTKIINRVTRSTLIDHISMWGALWGVLFAVFGLLFLSYNRSKFYRKNPDWDKFKMALERRHQQQARF